VSPSTAFAAGLRVDFQFTPDLSLLFAGALGSLLSFVVTSADALLPILLAHPHPPLLRHIRGGFVSQGALAAF
jgi:hypothetical protein